MPGVVRALRTSDGVDAIWRAGIGVAAALAVLVLHLFPSVHHEYDARLARDAARAPVVLAEDATGTKGVVGHWGTRDDSIEGEPVAVALLLPEGEPDQTPPGVKRWPGPAEVFASPGVLDVPGGQDLVARYGTLVGGIDPAVLADPREKVLYVGVDPTVLEEPSYWLPVTGFGLRVDPARGDDGYFGSTMYQSGRTSALSLVLVFALAPLLVLLVVLARLGGERRDATVALLVALGASRTQVRRALWRVVRVPIGVGVAVAALTASVLARVTWTVPYTGYVMSPSPDLRSDVSLLVSAVGGAALTWTAVLASTRGRRTAFASPRPVRAGSRATVRPVIALLAVLAAVNWLYALVNPTNPTTGTIVLFVGVLACVLLIGPVTASLLTALAGVVTAAASRGRRPVRMIVGRELASMARPAVRATIFMGVVALTATFATVLSTTPGDFLRQVIAASDVNAGRSVRFATGEGARWLPDLGRTLPEGQYLVGVQTDPIAGATALTASCETQVALLGRCAEDGPTDLGALTDGTVPIVLRVWGLDDMTIVRTGDPRPGEVLVISEDDRAVDTVALAQAMRPLVSPPPLITEPEASWVVGATVAIGQAGWIVVLGAVAGLFAVVMGSASLVAELARMRRRHRVFAIYAGGLNRHLGLGVGLVGLPLLLGAVVGCASAFAASWNAIRYGSASTTSVGPLLGVLLATGGVAAVAGSLGSAWATSRRDVARRGSG